MSTVYVLRGSPRMKHLGKGKTLSAPRVASPIFPPGTVSTVIPALETAAIAPPAAVYQKPVYRCVYPVYLRYQSWISYRPYRTFFRGGFCY